MSKWVLEMKGGYFGVFDAKTELAAERKAKQIVLNKYYEGIRPAEQKDLNSLRAMGGTELK
jgi:hypothetical protein